MEGMGENTRPKKYMVQKARKAQKRSRCPPGEAAVTEEATTMPPSPQRHPIDQALAHVRPPLEPASLQQLTQGVKDLITKAVIDKARWFRRANEGSDRKRIADEMKPELRDYFLCSLNNAVPRNEIRVFLDVSVHNHAVKLLLSHYDEFKDKGKNKWALVAKKLKQPPFSPLTSAEACKALAKSLLETIPFQPAQCLLPLLKQEKTVKLSSAQRFALVGIIFEIDGLFKEKSVDIPWDGDAALEKLAGRGQTIVDVIQENYTLFCSRALAKAFKNKVMLWGPTLEFQVDLRDSRGVGHILNRPLLISDEKNARFRRPPHDIIVDKHLPTLQKGVLTVLIGASGAGKTMAALLTGTNASDCVLYFKASAVFSVSEEDATRDERVTEEVLAALTMVFGDHTSYLSQCPCPSPSLEPQCQCPSLSVTIVIDEAGAYGNELRGLCAVYVGLCADIAALLKVGTVHIVVAGTGIDVAGSVDVRSESPTVQVVPITARLWDDFSAALLNESQTAQLKRAVEIISEVSAATDPRTMLVQMLLDNARCAAIFARRLQESIADATEKQRASDERLREGLLGTAMMTVHEFMNLNALKNADRTAALHEVLVWTMNAWRRAAIPDLLWQCFATSYGIAVSGAVRREALPTFVDGSKTVAAASLARGVGSSTCKASGPRSEGSKGGALLPLLFQHQPVHLPPVHMEPASVAMLLLLLEQHTTVVRQHTCAYSALTLRAADFALLCCRVPAVDDSGGDPNVAVEALTPLRRIVNHMTVPLKTLMMERAMRHDRVLETDAGQMASTTSFEAQKVSIVDYHLRPGCFDASLKKGRDRVQALEALLVASHGALVLVTNPAAAPTETETRGLQRSYGGADVIALGRAKLVLFIQSNKNSKCNTTAATTDDDEDGEEEGVLTMEMVLNAFAEVTPPLQAVVGSTATDITSPSTGRHPLSEQLIGIGSGRGDISGWTCTPVVDAGPTVDQTANADFVVDTVLMHDASKHGGVNHDVVKAMTVFDPADPMRLVGTFPLLMDGALQQTVVYTPPAAIHGVRPLRVTYRYFFLAVPSTPQTNCTASGSETLHPFYPLV